MVADEFAFDTEKPLTVDEELLLLFEIRYKQELKAVALKMQGLMSEEQLDVKTTIWNERCQVEFVKAARYYTMYYILFNYHQALNDKAHKFAIIPNTSAQKQSPENKTILQMMYRNFALNHYLNEAYESFYENLPSEELVTRFGKRHNEYVRIYKEEQYALAMTSLDIVDAWGFHDDELASALGRKDYKDADEMYARILDLVRKNPLNQNEVPKGFNKYMRPLLVQKL